MTETRYGIFLRPDPATCWNVTQITTAIERQFGLVSAGAFPPHATLIGNLATDRSESTLIALLEKVFAEVRPIAVYNAGPQRTPRGGYEYNVNLNVTGDAPNADLGAVAAALKQAVLPILRPVADYLVTPVEEYSFAGHLGLASHDLMVEPELSDQIGEFIAGLPVTPPAPSFLARWYSLFRFESEWDEQWWKTLTWRHLRSWDVS